jgi:hypothetical protein
MLLLAIPAESVLGSRLQQNETQNASPEQQTPPTFPLGQVTSDALVQSVTGCIVRGDQGYSLKTASDTYPIEADEDLSHFVNRLVKLTGILQRHRAVFSSGNATTITDLRFRMITTVIGTCNRPSK